MRDRTSGEDGGGVDVADASRQGGMKLRKIERARTGMIENKKPFTWDYDYKERYRFADDRLEELDEAPVRAAFEAVGKSEDDYGDAISRLLAYKALSRKEGLLRTGEHECAYPSRDVLLKVGLPEGWEARLGENEYGDKLANGSRVLSIGYDAMNSFATTFNFSQRYLGFGIQYPPSAKKGLEYYEKTMRWPDQEGRAQEAWDRLERFARLAHTIGNFTYIPYMRFDDGGCGTNFNTRRGTGYLPARVEGDKLAYGPMLDYWDLSLEWLKKHWFGVDDGCAISFEEYVELARLELYCVKDEVAETFLEEARKGASPQGVIDAYDAVRAHAEEGGHSVTPFWEGHALDRPGFSKPQSLDQIISFLDAVTVRIEARGRLLIALYGAKGKEGSWN